MPVRFKLDPASGQYAIYTVPTPTSTDDAPLTNPLGNLSRVIVHPQLRYPGVVATISGTLSLAAATYNGPAVSSPEYRTHTLGAHGQSGLPMLIGRFPGLGVGGASVPWAGSVCVQAPEINLSGWPGPWPRKRLAVSRWLSLGVQGGNVVAFEVIYGKNGSPGAMSISYEVHIINRDLSAALPSSGPAQVTYQGNAFVMRGPYGTISSEHRYLKDGAGYAAPFALSGARTTTIRYNGTVGGDIVNETTFNHSFGSSVYEVIADWTVRDVSLVPEDPGEYVPAAAVNPLIKQVAL